MNDDTYNKSANECAYTAEEEALAEKEALAMVYGMGAGGIDGFDLDPLATPEGMAIFQAKKEEILRQLVADRLRTNPR